VKRTGINSPLFARDRALAQLRAGRQQDGSLIISIAASAQNPHSASFVLPYFCDQY
jgi:hypothetical protein